MTWFGDIYLATTPPKVKAKDIRKLLELLQPGDIICRRYIYYLDAYFIKGKYSHSGIIINREMMIHSIAEGVDYIDIIDYTKDCDGFILLRPNIDIQRSIAFAKRQVGKPYDFLFDKSEKDAFYCHELVFYSLAEGSLTIAAQIPMHIIYAEDVIKFCQKIYEV